MDNEEEVFMFVNNKLDVVDKMLTWVTNRAFDQTGVLQLVLNLDSGETEQVIGLAGSLSLYKHLCAKKEIVRDVGRDWCDAEEERGSNIVQRTKYVR